MMILRKLIREGSIHVHQSNKTQKQLLRLNNIVTHQNQQPTTTLLKNITYSLSRHKPQSKKKQPQSIDSYHSTNSPIDLSTLSKHDQFTTLRQGIYEFIDNRYDDKNLMDLMETFSNFITSNYWIKEGIVQFEQIVKKMKMSVTFRLSPNYHFALCQYRYFLVRAGRSEQAIKVSQDSIRLLKKGSQKQSLHVANELSTLGIVHFINNNYNECRKCLQKQDKMNQKFCDETYTQYMECKNNLAIVDFVQGKYDQAERTFEKNTQITKRILKSTRKGKEKLYAKHIVYLEAIYELKIARSQQHRQQEEEKVNLLLLKQKVIELNRDVLDILIDNKNAVNDVFLYYETIALHFLKIGQNELCIKFIQKAISLNQKKLEKPTPDIKRDRSSYEVTNTISKHYMILAHAFKNIKNYDKSIDCYLRAYNKYKKNIVSNQAKQLLTLQNFIDFIQCCRSLFHLQFIEKNQNKKTLEQTIKYIEEPLLVWSQAFKYIWKPPQWLIFIPYQLNIEIGIKLLQSHYFEPALMYFQVCWKEIQTNKNLLCEKSRKNLGTLAEKIKDLIEKPEAKQSQTYQKLKTFSNELNSLLKI